MKATEDGKTFNASGFKQHFPHDNFRVTCTRLVLVSFIFKAFKSLSHLMKVIQFWNENRTEL